MRTEPIDEIEYRGYTIRIYPDDDYGESPREWDNLGHMACFHSRYDLGDNYQNRPDGCRDANDFLEWLKENKDEIAILLPLYLYDHSGITMWTDDGIKRYHQHYAWDGGQVGYIYVLKSELRKELKAVRLSKKNLEYARKVLIGEVQVYDQYLTGDVYGYVLENDGEEIDSCWGYYPTEPHNWSEIAEQVKDEVDNIIKGINDRLETALQGI